MAGGKAKTGRQNGEKKMGWKEMKELRKPVNGLFHIEKIQRKWVGKNGEIFYYVRWWGYPKTYNTWEPPSSFTNCPEVVDEFEQSRELLASTRKNRGGLNKISRRDYARKHNQKGVNLTKLDVENTEVPEKECSVTEDVIAELEEAPDHVEVLEEVDIQPALEEHEDEGAESDSSSLVILQTESISVDHYQKILGGRSDVWNNENMEIPTLEPASSLEDGHSISSADTETMQIPTLVLEQSPVDDQFIRILKSEEIAARQKMTPKFIGTAVIKSKVYYIATCEDDGCTASITSNLALKFFPQKVVGLLLKVPTRSVYDMHCCLLSDGYCRLWEDGNDFNDLYAIRMHVDQQRFLIQPTNPGNLLCDDCLIELEYQYTTST